MSPLVKLKALSPLQYGMFYYLLVIEGFFMKIGKSARIAWIAFGALILLMLSSMAYTSQQIIYATQNNLDKLQLEVDSDRDRILTLEKESLNKVDKDSFHQLELSVAVLRATSDTTNKMLWGILGAIGFQFITVFAAAFKLQIKHENVLVKEKEKED